MNNQQLQQNLTLYPWYQACAGFLPWLPLFFLFFYQHIGLADVLRLSAVYYFSVFLLEVPSGYFSDRFGRKLTLLLSALFGLVAYLIFILGTSLESFAIGQFFVAGLFSFKTGSDNSLLYDSLQALNREDEYGQREANASRYGLVALAAAALLGGIAGTFNLAIPYYMAIAGSIATMIIASRFTEPPDNTSNASLIDQLRLCVSQLKNRELLWFFAFYVLSFSLAHIPYEFNQPYLLLLNLDWFDASNTSAFISGVMVAISMLGGALGATLSIRLMNKHGVYTLLLGTLVAMLLIVTGMALMLHPLLLVLVLFRNFPMALSEPPLLAAISPKIDSSYRATYLSLQSLAGRLGFALLLFVLSNFVGESATAENMTWSDLRSALMLSLVIGGVAFAALVALRLKASN